jgi:hypothetical protein
MKRSLDKLERLCQKMQSRYGPQDLMVLELMQELETKKSQYLQGKLRSADHQRSTPTRLQ